MKIVIIGAGISGLTAARQLDQERGLTIFEANDYLGGHTRSGSGRTGYGVPGLLAMAQRAEFPKAMHVSPFMPMDLRYGWHSTPPGLHLAVHLDVFKGPSRLLDTTLSLRRQPLDARSMSSVLLRFPLMTLKVIAAIHWEALRLLLKRIPLSPHPPNSGKPTEN
ncbi:MAG: FAD-dependent oxidoreductase [Candidatus Contendobacter sp.]|nr:FAD-dependent oxidoreductase [Candidatus Contendobacter sp.]